ncbi:MAG: hypothetical protein ACJ8BW_11420 [Ktedonobacteraceae bacterium]
MLFHLRLQAAFNHRFSQLLNDPVLTQQILKVLVVFEEFVQ